MVSDTTTPINNNNNNMNNTNRPHRRYNIEHTGRILRTFFVIIAFILCLSPFFNRQVREVVFGSSNNNNSNGDYSFDAPPLRNIQTSTKIINTNKTTTTSTTPPSTSRKKKIPSNINNIYDKVNQTSKLTSSNIGIINPTKINDNRTTTNKIIKSDNNIQTPTNNMKENNEVKNISDVSPDNIATSTVKGNNNTTYDGTKSSTTTKQQQNITNSDDKTSNNDNNNNNDTTRKPLNVLVLYPDDWRYDSIGGVAPYVQTPFLTNTLAREGIRFTHNCVTTSICWISRASFFTGQYCARHKSMLPNHRDFYKTFTKTRTSWPMMLQDAGYYTGHIGKWQYYEHQQEVRKNFFNWTSLHEGSHWYRYKERTGKQVKKHASDRARDDVFDFLNDRPKDKPFSLTVAFYPPKAVGTSSKPGAQWSPKPETEHLFDNVTIPFPNDTFKELPIGLKDEGVGRKRWGERFNDSTKFQISIKRYYRMIYEIDQVCKEIIDRLKQDGLYDNTLIIFTTDNGFFLGEHGMAGKWYPYEESIRVPLIIRDPRMPERKRNTLDDSFTLNIDLAETIIGAAGLKPASDMQGRDIADLYLRNVTDWRNEFYYEYPIMSTGKFPGSTALVRKDYKFMRWPQAKASSLYDLKNDPNEMNDLASLPEYQDIIKKMHQRHNELKDQAS